MALTYKASIRECTRESLTFVQGHCRRFSADTDEKAVKAAREIVEQWEGANPDRVYRLEEVVKIVFPE